MPVSVQTLTYSEGSVNQAIRAVGIDCKNWGLPCRGDDFLPVGGRRFSRRRVCAGQFAHQAGTNF
jgi:hypothetical protein